MIVLISGDRRLKFEYHYDVMSRVLFGAFDRWAEEIPDEKPFLPFIVVHGDARGADSIAAHWVNVVNRKPDTLYHAQAQRFEAKWRELGNRAGPVRNQQMIDYALALHVTDGHYVELHAFPTAESVGTRHMIRACADSGIVTRMYEQDVPPKAPRI